MKKKRRRLKKSVKRFLLFMLTIIIIIVLWKVEYNYNIRPVSSKSKIVDYEVTSGSTYMSLANSLKQQGLIRSKLFYKIYVKTHKVGNLNVGVYELNTNMSVKEIVAMLASNKTNKLSITFREGLNIRQMADIIAKKTNTKKEDFINLLKDTTYLDSLISKYWFLTDEIKNPSIYYSLEGYLLPDTYTFDVNNASQKEIVKAMLDNMDKKLKPYKSEIEKSNYTVHQVLTLASMVELEAISNSDRENVARVFYNRLKRGMSLGSDVTTYYGVKINVGERDLYSAEISAANSYNTRSSSLNGKLPVGPICNPSIDAIKESINPKENNYLYFVADKNRKLYFTNTVSEHTKIVAKLKKEGLWYEW